VAVVLVLAALAVRLYRIDAQGLWADEGGTAGYASLPLGELVATIAAHDPHPPLYYALLALWLPLAGPSDFAIRLPSALFVTLAVAALYRLGRRIGGPAAATAAALFAAFNPLLVWHGQEARMYALLVLGATVSALLFHRARQRGSWRAWLALAGALAATLYVHYFAAFLAGLHAVLAERAVRWRPDRWRALAAFALAAAAFVPWLRATDTLGYQGWMEPVDLATAARRAAWGLAVGTSIYPERGWLLAAPTLAAGALGALRLLWRRPRADFLLVLGWVVAPVAAAYGFGAATGRPSFHERYVIASAPGLMLLAGLGVAAAATPLGRLWRDLRLARAGGPSVRPGVAAAGAGGLLLAGALTVGVLGADARSLAWHFADPHFAKEDVRGAAAFVEARASVADGLVASPARAFLYDRYGHVPLGRLVSDVAPHEIEATLARFVAGRPRLWYLPADAEVDRVAEAWLDARAYRLDSRWFGLAPLKVWVFAPDPPGGGVSAELSRGGAPALRVEGVRFAAEGAPDGHVVRVVGLWTRLADVPALKASLRLVDARERVVAQRDFRLGGELTPPSSWPAGEPRAQRFALGVPPDVPGGRYGLRLVVYDGEALSVSGQPEWRLGEIDLAAVANGRAEQVEPAAADGRPVGRHLRLLGYDLPDTAVPAGGSARVVLHWQAVGPEAWRELPSTRLWADGAELDSGPEAATLEGAAPAPGGLLRDVREVRLRRGFAVGTHVVSLRDASGQGISLGRVRVDPAAGRAEGAPSFAADASFGAAKLVGFDARGDARPSGRLEIGLHFAPDRAFAADLKVFVHLVDAAGKIVAQHDGPPCGGSCPTSAWSGGERIVDQHPIELPATLPSGRYAVVVGLYDGRTGQRVARSDGAADQPDLAVLGDVTIAA
jgi:hypothetical protein